MAKRKTTPKSASKPKSKSSPAADAKPAEAASEAPAKIDAPQVELVGLQELADQLRLPAMRVRQMLRAGQIQGVKVDGQWRFNSKLIFQTLGRRARGR